MNFYFKLLILLLCSAVYTHAFADDKDDKNKSCGSSFSQAKSKDQAKSKTPSRERFEQVDKVTPANNTPNVLPIEYFEQNKKPRTPKNKPPATLKRSKKEKPSESKVVSLSERRITKRRQEMTIITNPKKNGFPNLLFSEAMNIFNKQYDVDKTLEKLREAEVSGSIKAKHALEQFNEVMSQTQGSFNPNQSKTERDYYRYNILKDALRFFR